MIFVSSSVLTHNLYAVPVVEYKKDWLQDQEYDFIVGWTRSVSFMVAQNKWVTESIMPVCALCMYVECFYPLYMYVLDVCVCWFLPVLTHILNDNVVN